MSVICVSDMMDKDYKQYVLSSVEKEGHIYFFNKERVSEISLDHHKADSDIHLTVSWRKHI